MLSFDNFMGFFNSHIPDGIPLQLPILNKYIIFSKVNLTISIFTLKNGFKNTLT